jgi:hypothetical protein
MRRSTAEPGSASDPYSAFIRLQAGAYEPAGPAPATLAAWDQRLARVRAGLTRSFGRMPAAPCPLEPEILGVLLREGYAIERLTFQSRPTSA